MLGRLASLENCDSGKEEDDEDDGESAHRSAKSEADSVEGKDHTDFLQELDASLDDLIKDTGGGNGTQQSAGDPAEAKAKEKEPEGIKQKVSEGDAEEVEAEFPSDEAPPEGKECYCCKCSPDDRTSYEVDHGYTWRLWGLANFWGVLCYWCKCAINLRWSWLRGKQVETFLMESEQNRLEALEYSMAYSCLRIGGRGRVSIELLEARRSTNAIYEGVLKVMQDSKGDHVGHKLMLVEDCWVLSPKVNPVLSKYRFFTVEVNGVDRIAVRMPCQRPAIAATFPENVLIDPYCPSNHLEDIEKIKVWAKEAADEQEHGGNTLQSQATSSTASAQAPQDSSARQTVTRSATKPATDKAMVKPGRRRSAGGRGQKGGKADQAAQLDEEIVHEEIISWPKDPKVAGIKKTHGKVSALIVNLTSKGWVTAVNISALRNLHRLATEQKDDVKNNRNQVLIDVSTRNLDALDKLKALSNSWSELEKHECDENILSVSKAMEPLIELLSQRNLKPHVDLVIYKFHGDYLTQVGDHDIEKGIQLVVEQFHAAKLAYEKLVLLDSERQPRDFLRFVEGELLESSAISSIRLAATSTAPDGSITVSREAVDEVYSFFQKYDAGISGSGGVFSEGLLIRGHALKVMVSVLQNEFSYSPSVVSAEDEKFTSYKENALVTALAKYPFGIAVGQRVERVKERGKEDAKADVIVDQAERNNEPISGRKLVEFTQVADVSKLTKHATDTVSRVTQATEIWSHTRFEEQAATCAMLLKTAAFACLQSDFILSDQACAQLSCHARSLQDSFEGSAGVGKEFAQQASVFRAQLDEYCSQRLSVITEHEESIRVVKSCLSGPIKSMFERVHKLPLLEFAAKLDPAVARKNFWTNLLSGLEAMLEIACEHAIVPFQEAYVAYTTWQQARVKKGAVSLYLEKPYLESVLVFAACRAEVLNAPALQYTVRIPGSGGDLGYLTNFLHSSVGEHFYKQHCTTKVNESCTKFFEVVDLTTAKSIDKEHLNAAQLVGKFGLVSSADPKTCSEIVKKNCDFSDLKAPVVGRLPHLSTARVTTAIISKVLGEEGTMIPELQRASSKPLPPNYIIACLALHSNAWTLSLLMGAAQYDFVETGSITTQRGEVDQSLPSLLLSIQRSHKQAEDGLKSHLYSEIENREFGLKTPIGHFRLWLVASQHFSDTLTNVFLLKATEYTKIKARDLQDALPRWEQHITDTDFHATLAKEAVLDNARRDEIAGLSDKLLAITKFFEEAAKQLTPSLPPLRERNETKAAFELADKVGKSAQMAMLLRSSMQAIFVHGMKAAGTKLAEQCLELATDKEFKGGALPKSLEMLLQKLRNGDRAQIAEFIKEVEQVGQPATKKKKTKQEKVAASPDACKQEKVMVKPEEFKMEADKSTDSASVKTEVENTGPATKKCKSEPVEKHVMDDLF